MSEPPSSRDDDAERATDDTDRETATDDDAATDAEPGDGGLDSPSTAGAPNSPADSRWWYWVAALPVYVVVASVVGFVVGFAAFALALTGATTVEYGMGMWVGPGAGLGFFAVVVTVLMLVAVGMLLSLVFPVAIYLDAEAVAETAGDWEPDPMLYGLVALAGVVAQPLQVPLAVYYLYKRHESEGVP